MVKRTDKDENKWMELFRNGDERALAHFFKLHYRTLCYFVSGIVEDDSEAEDIASVAFVKLWENRSGFESAVNVKAYLFISCRNASLNYLKQAKRRSAVQQEYMNHLDELDPQFMNRIIESEFLNTLHLEVQQLPEQCRKVFSMLYFEGKKTAEIAEVMDLSVKTVRNYKARAIESLHNSFLKKHVSDALYFAFFLFFAKR